MKTYEIVLTKSYLVKITAKNRKSAKEFAELFTGDVVDISTEYYRKKFRFKIESIDCKMNEASGV